MDSDVTIREKNAVDDNFILHSWCESYRYNIVFGAIPKNIYFKHYRKFSVKILSISNCFVACNPDDSNQIYGFCVYRYKEDMPIISYVFIKHAFRRFGIATMLVNKLVGNSKIITHFMPSFERRFRRAGLVFDPFFDWKEYYEIRR